MTFFSNSYYFLIYSTEFSYRFVNYYKIVEFVCARRLHVGTRILQTKKLIFLVGAAGQAQLPKFAAPTLVSRRERDPINFS